jgi:hypothetical protein
MLFQPPMKDAVMEPIGVMLETPVRVHVYEYGTEFPRGQLFVIMGKDGSGCWFEDEAENASVVRDDLKHVVDILKSHGYSLDTESMSVTPMEAQESVQEPAQEPLSNTQENADVVAEQRPDAGELPAVQPVLSHHRGHAAGRKKKGQ